jgi:septal ring-binding cell division protein DamX
VDASLPLRSPDPSDMDKWVATALRQNLAIIAARANVDISKATVSGDVGNNLPSLALQGSYSQVSMANKALNPANPNVSSVGLYLSVPIVSGGSMLAQTRKDAYTQEANQQALDSTISNTIAGTRTNYMAVMAAMSSVQAAKQSYISADKSLKAVQAGYQVGTNTITDVLTDMSTRVQAQEGIVTNQVAYLNAIIALKEEAGTLGDSDVEAISSILSKTVVLPNTLSRENGGTQNDSLALKTSVVKSSVTTKPSNAPLSEVKVGSASTSALPYSIQLYVSSNEGHAKTFIHQSLGSDSKAYIAMFVNHGRTFYAVMLGHYATHNQAAQALSHLPAHIQALKPWVKKVS